MYRIHQIKLNIGESWDVIPDKIRRALNKPKLVIDSWQVVKESIDARDKGDLKMVYSVDFQCGEEIDCQIAPNMNYVPPMCVLDKAERPVVVGFGPAGLFAALTFAQMGYKPIVLERGKAVDERSEDVNRFWQEGKLDPESNVQFGEGGAGTFSDGKLTTGIKDYRMRKVAQEFVNFGANEEILYKQKPHIGTDVLKVIVANMREEIIRLGGQVRFSSKLTDIVVEDNVLKAVKVNDDEVIPCNHLVLSIGHSARDTFKMLNERGLNMAQKPFSIGLRIEHPQSVIDRSQYGNSKEAKLLPPAEYKLSYKTKAENRGVYTFCMCPGGEVINASSEEGYLVTNGMSNSKRDSGVANSAVLCDVRTSDFGSDHPLAGVDFQRKYEKLAFEASTGNYKIPSCQFKDFEGSTLYNCLPDFAAKAICEAMGPFGRKIKGFDAPDAVFKGVESRSSSPVRLLRNKCYEGSIKGIYPTGEGAGYAGGIVSAAVDGIKVAESIIMCKENEE